MEKLNLISIALQLLKFVQGGPINPENVLARVKLLFMEYNSFLFPCFKEVTLLVSVKEGVRRREKNWAKN